MSAQVVHIASLNDPHVDVYRNVRDADLRGRDDLFMAESELVIRRLLHTPQRLHSLLLSPERYARLESELESLPPSVPVFVADLKLMHEIAAFHVHRGVLAAGFRLPPEKLTLDAAMGQLKKVVSQPPAEPGATERVIVLIAEGITNVDNMGALFRNAVAFGVAGIVLDPISCDPLYRKAIRVSMGHALSIPYAVCSDWPGDLARLKQEWGMTIVAAESRAGARPMWDMPRSPRTALLFGSEGHGVSDAALQWCDAVCEIPMTGEVPSINVAVASAVALYELQRHQSHG